MPAVHYEPMFVHMKKIPTKAADALDLMIEFSTLGEYGLEYPQAGPDEDPRNCERRARRQRQAPGNRSRHPVRCSSEATDFASALRPPRIRLSFTD